MNSQGIEKLLLDDIADGGPHQINFNKIGQESASESSLSDSGCQSSVRHSTLSPETYSTLSSLSKKLQEDNDDYNIIINYKVLK